MLKWGSGDVSATKSGALGPFQAASISVTNLTEKLVQNEQLVAGLKELVREKDNELCLKAKELKKEKEAPETKISKLKLQNKAKVISSTTQLEELKKQLSGDEIQEGISKQKRAASRGKILVQSYLGLKLPQVECFWVALRSDPEVTEHSTSGFCRSRMRWSGESRPADTGCILLRT
ncbi:Hypothetical predicted protein [Podarcis lilfordi]|uniref:Uncharacterized protein n=1 Tax=Podarcis lilfordi TaxID=74358 RepID=A0AA35LB09_9SAUR|nr:Hypothetical predicted protein [Podarcis lilfordi]